MSKVRIIGGTHRSRLIEVPDSIGLRPTPDRVRETLFNWLGQELDGLHCLDLFAGSGALGFEAASREAASVTLLELAPKVASHLRENQAKLAFGNLKLITGDALKYLQNTPERFDLVFLDPPYRQGWLERLEPHLAKVLAPGARVYLEAEEAVDAYAGLALRKSGKAGQVHYRLFALPPAGESA
ncbi:16S rRNA (guanine(966)-N(2))-methyltransferase RsmD [Uliginosibacterium aquaticum]|uniref:16S rRNA (Guanine(966)-N(2))-methyltransferase RsmD n=1 Tax=Uliginosibacterium aquaticum TaxID=2731212 RepID=A0ABX2IJ16_9RHOO|nr:16S rRNA (guanine(966)-N(2))-methyltransferase RsmD [Uliginosibacterium aquaticum]NSL56287.1 16S rRNA (guanine(966)-N(2))-methyltransferase RsmD [Uliginosibacterium aquaticum]